MRRRSSLLSLASPILLAAGSLVRSDGLGSASETVTTRGLLVVLVLTGGCTVRG
jgi:hypothetical protein